MSTYKVYTLHVESDDMSPDYMDELVRLAVDGLAQAVDNGTPYAVELHEGQRILAAYEGEG